MRSKLAFQSPHHNRERSQKVRVKPSETSSVQVIQLYPPFRVPGQAPGLDMIKAQGFCLLPRGRSIIYLSGNVSCLLPTQSWWLEFLRSSGQDESGGLGWCSSQNGQIVANLGPRDHDLQHGTESRVGDANNKRSHLQSAAGNKRNGCPKAFIKFNKA